VYWVYSCLCDLLYFDMYLYRLDIVVLFLWLTVSVCCFKLLCFNSCHRMSVHWRMARFLSLYCSASRYCFCSIPVTTLCIPVHFLNQLCHCLSLYSVVHWNGLANQFLSLIWVHWNVGFHNLVLLNTCNCQLLLLWWNVLEFIRFFLSWSCSHNRVGGWVKGIVVHFFSGSLYTRAQSTCFDPILSRVCVFCYHKRCCTCSSYPFCAY
jgi:hypothetical protein